MRFGGPVFVEKGDPDTWVAAVKQRGYRAAYCPVGTGEGDEIVDAYARAAKAADIVIAEVGAWSNPISRDPIERAAAIDKCKSSLALAERIGARCCVNISGSRGAQWDGPDAANLTPETFDLIVETVRDIVDTVRPSRTFYVLEPMPWAFPESPQSYLRLIKAIDRKSFSVHLDPVNWITSPALYFNNGSFMEECFRLLGPHIKACHAKDIRLSSALTVHLDEARPGTGNLDYSRLLREMDKLAPDTPLMLEHLSSEEEFDLAASFVRSVAHNDGLSL